MSVNQLRPYERHIVSNISALLPAGNTLAALGTGQIGIFDAKTNLSVTAPTYATNKAIYFAQGTPDRSGFPEGAGVPNIYRKSHVIEGKKLLGLRGKKASRGFGEVVVLGNTGAVGDTNTLSAKPGSTFYYWIRLTGDPIFNLNPDRAKGVIIQGAVQMPCAADCADNCTTVGCNVIADKILEDYNGHFDDESQKFVGGKFLPGGQRANAYVQMCKVLGSDCTPTVTTIAYDACELTVADDGSQSALGAVQAQAGGTFIVTRTKRDGIFSTYQTAPKLSPSACPASFDADLGTVISDCDVCPTGYTGTDLSYNFTVLYNGDPTGIGAIIKTAVEGVANTGVVTVTQQALGVGITQFTINVVPTVASGTAAAALAVAIEAALVALIATTLPHFVVASTVYFGDTGKFCTKTTPAPVAWTDLGDVCNKAEVSFNILLSVGDCNADPTGAALLAELQAAYPGTTITSESTADACVHKYTLVTVSQNCVPDNCCAQDVVFPSIAAFNGTSWVAEAVSSPTPDDCNCGIKLTSNFVRRKESECTFGNWVHQTDWAHIEISSHNPDWRSTDLCEQDPIATRVQGGAYPNGEGPMVVRLEKADRMYEMDYFYLSPVLREAFDFYFEAKFDQYYDMVAVDYNYSYASNDGFGQFDTDNYTQYFWLPETETGALTAALNGYAASIPIMIDPVVL